MDNEEKMSKFLKELKVASPEEAMNMMEEKIKEIDVVVRERERCIRLMEAGLESRPLDRDFFELMKYKFLSMKSDRDKAEELKNFAKTMLTKDQEDDS